MSKSIYIYSTLTAPVSYDTYSKGDNDLPNRESRIVIAGGHGIANKHLVTPRGVVTSVSEDELAMLEQNRVFQMHRDNGFIVIEKRKVNPEVVAADMEGRDGSAPIVPEDFGDNDAAKPYEVKDVTAKGRKKL